MPWTHRDFAQMHYLHGLFDGDAQGAAKAFRNEYIFHKRWGSSPKPDNSNEEDDADLIFPTGIDILRIHKLYQKGELPDENTITGGRREGERIYFSYHEEMRRNIDKFKKDLLKASQELLKKCKDETFFDRVLWTGIAEICCKLFCGLGYERFYFTDHDDGKDYVVNVWVGMLAGEVIGPFEMPDQITDEHYAKFLKEDHSGLFDDVPIDERKKIYIHVEDKYVGKCVTKFLDEYYEGKWIGPNGPINWPVLAWDLNPVKYIWAYVINHVYRYKCDSKEEILEKVIIGCDGFEQSERVDKEDKERGTIKSTYLKLWNSCVKENGADVSSSLYQI